MRNGDIVEGDAIIVTLPGTKFCVAYRKNVRQPMADSIRHS
jgi:hypothetical protein